MSSDAGLSSCCHTRFAFQALSHAGSRFFAKAEETLEEAHRLARRAGDPTAVAVSECLQIRLFISQGAFHLAFAHPPHTRSLTKSLTAELLASHALARAGAGETAKSLDLAAEAERILWRVRNKYLRSSRSIGLRSNHRRHQVGGETRFASSACRPVDRDDRIVRRGLSRLSRATGVFASEQGFA